MRIGRWTAIAAPVLAGALLVVVSKPLWFERGAGPGTPRGVERSRGLELPQADQAEESAGIGAGEETTVVNVYHRRTSPSLPCSAYDSGQVCREDPHWRVSIGSKECAPDAMRGPLEAEANVSMEDHIDPQAGRRLSRRRVRVRADRNAPYRLPQEVIVNCGLVGLYKVELGAEHPFLRFEGKIDTWLPATPGLHGMSNPMVVFRAIPRTERKAEEEPEWFDEFRVAMYWDTSTRRTTRKWRGETISDDVRLKALILDDAPMREGFAPLVIDAAAGVPWGEIVNVINLAKRNGIDRIEYALPAK